MSAAELIWPDQDDGYEHRREALHEYWPAATEPVVHWQHPSHTEARAVCHGRRTTAPVTTDRAAVTCGTCRQSRTWKAAA